MVKANKTPIEKPCTRYDRGRWCMYRGRKYLIHFHGKPIGRKHVVALIAPDEWTPRSGRRWVFGHEIKVLPDPPIDLGRTPVPDNATLPGCRS